MEICVKVSVMTTIGGAYIHFAWYPGYALPFCASFNLDTVFLCDATLRRKM